MKKILLAASIALIFSSCAQNKTEGNLHVTGNVEGLKNGTLYIQKLQDTTLVLLDSIPISGDSKFESHLTIDSPEMLYLFLDRGETKTTDNSLMFFAEPGNINIETNLETFFANAKITGSKNHALYQDFLKVKSRYLGQELDLTEKSLKAYQKGEPFSNEENNVARNAIIKRRYLYAINFALNNKDFEVAPFVALSEINDANIKYLDTIHRSLSPQVAKSKYGKMLTNLIDERKQAEPQ